MTLDAKIAAVAAARMVALRNEREIRKVGEGVVGSFVDRVWVENKRDALQN